MKYHTFRVIAHKLFQMMRWLGTRERSTLICLVLASFGIWAFANLADEVIEGETREVDRAILLAMRSADDPSDPWGPRWVEELGRDLTALGGLGVLTFLTLAVCGFLVLERKRRAMWLVLGAISGGWLVSSLLKFGFSRPRPDLVPHLSHVYSSSFPSGHSMMSAVTYLTLGALLARVQPRRTLKAYFLCLAILLTVSVGISRVYLGVHWPTDVLAGWAVGSSWALVCWLVARRLQREGQVEKDVDTVVAHDS